MLNRKLLPVNESAITNAIAKLGTPLFVIYSDRFLENILQMQSAFCNRYSPTILAYSFKTNYVPYLCNLARQLGAYAEVVSGLEYDLALRVGYSPDKVIYNGPVKERESLQRALNSGSLVNVHSMYEIDAIMECAKEVETCEARVGIRVNTDLRRPDGSSPRPGSRAYSRFGFTVADGSLEAAVRELQKEPRIKVVGLHGHSSTTTRDTDTYARITDTLCGLGVDLIGDQLEFIDVGGGFYGKLPPELAFPGAPTLDDYAETICKVMTQHFPNGGPDLIIEPGTAVCADCMTYFSRVLDVYSIDGRILVLVDGSAIQAKPTFHTKNLPINILKQDKASRDAGIYSIVGFTCMENDFIARDVDGDIPMPGDVIAIDNCGAYTIVMSPQFISGRPPIVAIEQGKAILIRRRDTFDDVFGPYVFHND